MTGIGPARPGRPGCQQGWLHSWHDHRTPRGARRPERRAARRGGASRAGRCSSWPGPAPARPGRWSPGPPGCASRACRPSRILLLTFTRRAADDMLARARPPDAPAAERIWGGTFHAIAHRIIRAHAESFALPPEFSVIDPADVADVLDTLRAEHDLVGTRRRAPRAGDLRRHLHPLREHRHAAGEVIAAGYPWCAEFASPARRPVPGLRRAQAGARPGRLRRPAAAVAGRAGRRGRRRGAARRCSTPYWSTSTRT